ncbi:MAG TPA: hypothetical protein PKL83_02245, partial [bacterium]|nr:hypothetical protein [bacterium]
MDIKTTEEKVFIMKEQISLDQAEGRAWGRKLDAFGTLTKMASILQKPQDDDFEMVYKEHRLQPFWHVFCRATYDYERRASYTVPVDKPEVKSVTAAGTQYEIAKGAIALPVVEHCHEDLIKEKYVDGLLGKHDP